MRKDTAGRTCRRNARLCLNVASFRRDCVGTNAREGEGGINMRRFRFVLSSLSILAALATPVASMAQISIRIPPPITVTVPPPVTITVPPPVTVTVPPPIAITVAPPELPVYEQPALPAPGYIWTPGYWAYGSEGYFWVPGTWVQPPSVGLLWTPGYWGWRDGVYGWNAGYWGPHIGFYGGVNYGCVSSKG